MLLMALAALLAGVVNALAGGGTLITFPVMTALGMPAVSANITNTIALCPGYFGGSWAQRRDLKGQKKRLLLLLPVALAGGVAGGYLLLISGEKLFTGVVPWLILFAVLLLLLQPVIKKRVEKMAGQDGESPGRRIGTALLVLPSAAYGGYFGAGLGVILLAVLGITLKENMVRLNALKQVLSLTTNVAAAVFFVFSDQVYWPAALLMMACALAGGYLGGRLAGIMKPALLRYLIVAAGFVVFLFMLLK